MFVQNFIYQVNGWVNVMRCVMHKMHKLSTNSDDDVSFRRIGSNTGTATYRTAKYLAKLMSP